MTSAEAELKRFRGFEAYRNEIYDGESSQQSSCFDETDVKVEQIICENRRITLDDTRIFVSEDLRATIHNDLSETGA